VFLFTGSEAARLFYIQTVSTKKKGKPAQESYKTVLQDHPSIKTNMDDTTILKSGTYKNMG